MVALAIIFGGLVTILKLPEIKAEHTQHEFLVKGREGAVSHSAPWSRKQRARPLSTQRQELVFYESDRS
jgi:hypothetical protein